MLSVLQYEQGSWAHLLVLEFTHRLEALLAYGHAAVSLIVVVAGDSETHGYV